MANDIHKNNNKVSGKVPFVTPLSNSWNFYDQNNNNKKSITVKYFQLIVDNPSTTNIIRKEINNTQRELTCPTHTHTRSS